MVRDKGKPEGGQERGARDPRLALIRFDMSNGERKFGLFCLGTFLSLVSVLSAYLTTMGGARIFTV